MNRKILIADDEAVVREGMKTIIDWNACGFDICAEASNGIEAVQKIIDIQPDLVILDIKMPKLSGIDVAKKVRENNFTGSIIILSGYSDFSFAQSAITSGVDFYLLKPIDEDELIQAVNNVRKKLDNKSRESTHIAKARNAVIADLIQGKLSSDYDISDTFGISLLADAYQIVIIEINDNTEEELNDLFLLVKRLLCDSNSAEMAIIHDRAVFFLKGRNIIERLPDLTDNIGKYSKGSKQSPVFIAAGRVVENLSDISLSYEDARNIDKKRFFCDENQQFVSYEILKLASSIKESDSKLDLNKCAEQLLSYIEAANTNEIGLTMGWLYDELRFINLSPENIRSFLSNIYIRIKSRINENYKHLNINFPSDEEIISTICEIPVLYKILQYLKNELLRLAEYISMTSANSVVNKIIHYISYHYAENIKLESLAKMFGYNSTYLGKTFKSSVGEPFNLYLEKVRIDEAKKLLLTNLKVYEVSEKTGFKDTDCFYKKFKKNTGKNPGDYRKDAGLVNTEN